MAMYRTKCTEALDQMRAVLMLSGVQLLLVLLGPASFLGDGDLHAATYHLLAGSTRQPVDGNFEFHGYSRSARRSADSE